MKKEVLLIAVLIGTTIWRIILALCTTIEVQTQQPEVWPPKQLEIAKRADHFEKHRYSHKKVR